MQAPTPRKDTTALLEPWALSCPDLGPRSQWPAEFRVIASLVLSASHPMFMAWGTGLRLVYNEAYGAILGECHPEAFGARFETVHPEAWPALQPMVERVMTGQPAACDDLTVLVQRNGQECEAHFAFSYTPIIDAGGVVRGFFCTCTETTETVMRHRGRAEEERRRMALFEKAPGFMCVLRGPDHVYEFANEAYETLMGKRDVIGRTVREVFPEVEDQGFFQLLDNVYATGERFVAHAMPARVDDGPGRPLRELILDFIWEPIREADGRVGGIFAMGYDVTQTVRAEEAVRSSEQRFRAAVSAVGVLWTTNAEGEAVGEQAGWEQLTGLAQAEYQGQGWVQAVHPEDAQATLAAWREAVRTRSSFFVEHRVRRRDGVWRRFAARAVPVLEVDGRVREWVGVHIDVTEVAEATEALRQADRRKDEFIATLAHELRNPLAPVRTAAHLLSRGDLPPDRVAWCSDLITRQVHTMAVLLDDLLDVSRITTGRLELRRTEVQVAEVVNSAVEIARPLIDARQHKLHVQLAPALPQLDGDPVRVAQVLANLLVNAAKYTDPQGTIGLTVRGEGGQVVFEVEDNGIGIAAEDLPGIFEMFGQVNPALDRSEGGLGIGLALTRGLVHLHGGSIEAHSAGPGQGSRFVVRLPAAQGGPDAEPACQPRAGTTRHRYSVLVVDDNVDAARSLAMLLETEGFDAHVAHDGRGALVLGEAVRPRAALLDIGMRGMSGYELATEIRRTAWGQGAALAAVTGWGQDEDRRRALAAGFDGHFTKPVDPDDIVEWLTRQAAAPAVSAPL